MRIFPIQLKKISHKLTVVYALLFFVALVCVNAATLLSIGYYMSQSSIQQLELIDSGLKKEITTLATIPQIDFKNIAQMTNNVDINLIVDGQIVYNTGESYDLPQLTNNATKSIKSTDVGEKELLYLNDQQVLADGKVMTIQIIKDMDNERDYLYVLSGIMLVMDALMLIISILVGYFISKKALNPIDKITSQAKQISASDLTRRIKIKRSDDELSRLADTFNDLIARIQYAYDKQNQFTLDASHELATPLAVIKGYTDLIDRWGKNDPEILNEGIQSIKNELSNMTQLLDTLLFVAKSDNEILKVEKKKFWLNELIEEIVRESKLVTENHVINLDNNDKILITADKRLIKQMLRALIDNSIKYTPLNGTIEMNSQKSKKQAKITISDSGVGIPKDELSHIFDRFYRVDKARSREFGGTGLGLSIVKWIVDNHGGSIDAESDLGKGTKMTISLPLEHS
ncbi:sensor histidine kinase [Acetobacterium woodii]|uniref:histidine kinase n=1 Tax=Acetobacterium woodii (strain ATCC 29683 / DSM 1030 / JCM 2381 / KCTC 1655 / WB1) TaxID=931626 RepID=H6LFJ1_ACEWD|nr:ATP-binding protein [Acetobacterium woodii]AFA49478.1 sensor histidine kinase [Acetobacterium woodii DSM 1030]